jgi:uncharacterized membrane-anchored protein YhcB (DUF1043 family)
MVKNRQQRRREARLARKRADNGIQQPRRSNTPWYLALVGAVALGGLGGLIYKLRQDQPATQRQLELSVTHTINDSELRTKGHVPQPGKLESLMKPHMQQYAQRAHHLGDPATNLTFNVHTCDVDFVLLSPEEQKETNELIPVMKEVIQFMQQKYVKTGMKPVEFELTYPESTDVLQKGLALEHRPIPLYLISSVKRTYHFEVVGEDVSFQDGVVEHGVAGSAGLSQDIEYSDQNHVSVKYSMSPIILAQHKPMERRLSTPGEEVLHCMLHPYTAKYSSEEFFEKMRKLNAQGIHPTDKETRKLLMDVTDDYVLASEFMVHGSARAFFGEYVANHLELGINHTDLGRHLNWDVQAVRTSEQMVGKKGLLFVLANYTRNPKWILKAVQKP